MIQILVNGQTYELNAQSTQTFTTVVDQIREKFNTETSIVSNIAIDGKIIRDDEITETLRNTPIGEIGSIEVFTSHPKEVAEETLDCLESFTIQLEKLSILASEQIKTGSRSEEFFNLSDGLRTFSDAIHQVKIILKSNGVAPLPMLEADLTSILKDIFEFTQSGDLEYVTDLLAKHLPQNLKEWREQGLPALRRSRDS
jgi:hypothetical protein